MLSISGCVCCYGVGKAAWPLCFTLIFFKRETELCEGFPNWCIHIQFGHRADDATSTHTCLYCSHSSYASLQGLIEQQREEISTVQSRVGGLHHLCNSYSSSCSASSTTSVTQSCIDIWQKSGGSKEGSWWRYARCPCEAHPDAGLHFQLHPGLSEAIVAWRASVVSIVYLLYKEQVDWQRAIGQSQQGD